MSNAAVLLFGRIEMTEGMIANALYHLLTTPEALAQVRSDMGLMTAVVEESLRMEPAASVIDRYATVAVELSPATLTSNLLFVTQWASRLKYVQIF